MKSTDFGADRRPAGPKNLRSKNHTNPLRGA